MPGMSHLEKRRLRGDLVSLCKLPRRGNGAGGAGLFPLVSSDRAQGNSTKLPQGRLGVGIRKNFFTVKVAKHQNRLLGEVFDGLQLSVFKKNLDNALLNTL